MTVENINETINEEETNIDEENSTDASQNTDEQKVDNRIPYDRFKQKVDEANALKEKLAEIERAQEEAKRKELEEQNEYKQLYEQALEQAEQAKQETLTIKKNALLAQAGYNEEQIKVLSQTINGDTDEEIAEAVENIKATIPAQDNYADPSPFNGERAKPKTVDAEEVGRNAVSRVLHKIRL